MRSHNFQDTELKLYRYVNDSPGQVVEGLAILRYPGWNFKRRCLTVGKRSPDLRPLSRDRSVTFFKKFPNCSKRPKT